MRRFKITLTTDSGGAATGFTPRVSGKVHSIQYVKPAAVSFTDGVDLTVTAEETGESIWAENNVNASAVRYPRAATHSQAGAAVLYAAGGTAVQDRIAVANDRIKIVVAQGGNAKTGDIYVLVD